MLTGLGVTFKTMMKPTVTVQYPHEREDPPPRARGVIALKEENCTVCMLCARSCPDWCIYIEGHKEQRPPRREGGRPRSVSVLDRFDIDYALCMYCGICVEVCPFDALFWSPEFEYSERRIAELLHDKDKLGEWMDTVPEPEPLELGAAEGQEVVHPVVRRAENIAFGIIAAAMALGAIGVVTTKNVVHAALFLVVVLAGGAAQFILLGQEFVAWVQVLVYIGAVIVLFLFGIMLTRAPMHPKDSLDNDLRWPGARRVAVPGRHPRRAAHRHVRRLEDRPRRARSAPIEVTNSLFRDLHHPVRGRRHAAARRARSAPSSWRGRTERDAAQPVPPPQRVPLLHRHLRRADAQAHGARADERRADARGREHQPRRLRRVPPHGRRARCSRCSCSRSRPPRSASASRSSCSSTATCTAPISTTSTC